MEAKEFRIGNWYNWYADGKYYQYQVEPKDFVMGSMPNYEGVPLTEEWILKFGFTKHWEDFYNDVIYIKNVTDDYIEFEWGVYPNELGSGIQIKNSIKLKYVHQLQNLYFALTGEELTLKQQ